MSKKKILIVAIIACITGVGIFELINKKSENTNNTPAVNVGQNNTIVSEDSKTDAKSENKQIAAQISKSSGVYNTEKREEFVKKVDIYKDTSSSVMPLSAIAELSDLPANIRDSVSTIAKRGNIYMLQKQNDKIFIISDNNENIRHGIDFVEISLINGHHTQTTIGYSGKMQDSDNDIWEYNSETKLPTRHTKYNSEGDMEFVEIWNYDPENPVKYEMKDAGDKVISIRKETQPSGTDLRIEHLLYDSDGNTRMNVSVTYDGSDIKRFTYYNADKISQSGSIFSEYSDGYKTKETVYTSDFKVKNTYTSEYKDGQREDIIKFDNKNQEVNKYIPLEDL